MCDSARASCQSSTSSRHRLLRLALLLPVGVDEGVREDPVEPGLEVGARLELVERGVGLREGLLHQVLGICGVAGHAHRRGVELVQEGQGVALEARGPLGLRLGGHIDSVDVVDVRGLGHRSPAYGGQRPVRLSRALEDRVHDGHNRSAGHSIPDDVAHHPLQHHLDDDPHRVVLTDVGPLGHGEAVVTLGTTARSVPGGSGSGNSSGLPNGSLPPWITSVGTAAPASSSSRDFSGFPGGWSGNDRARQPAAPSDRAERQADRAPAERPPRMIGVRTRMASTAARSPTSRVAGGVATLPPARRHGCSNSMTLTPCRGGTSPRR